nr:glycoside hydrolase [Bacteroidales bacterium]
NNLGLAQRLIDDMNVMQPQAWLDWQIMEEWNNTWCLIRGNFDEESYTTIKNYYVRMHVTRFIKQGYTIIKTSDNNTLAAISPDEKEMTIVTVNLEEQDKKLEYNISKMKDAAKVNIYRTSNEENCSLIKTYTSKTIKATAKAHSIITLTTSITL